MRRVRNERGTSNATHDTEPRLSPAGLRSSSDAVVRDGRGERGGGEVDWLGVGRDVYERTQAGFGGGWLEVKSVV